MLRVQWVNPQTGETLVYRGAGRGLGPLETSHPALYDYSDQARGVAGQVRRMSLFKPGGKLAGMADAVQIVHHPNGEPLKHFR